MTKKEREKLGELQIDLETAERRLLAKPPAWGLALETVRNSQERVDELLAEKAEKADKS